MENNNSDDAQKWKNGKEWITFYYREVVHCSCRDRTLKNTAGGKDET